MIVDLGESQPRKNGHAIPTDKEIKRETDIKKSKQESRLNETGSLDQNRMTE